MPRSIRDFALIGDCHTAALVDRDATIGWLCWPRFDSPAFFAGLLGSSDNGYWALRPTRPCLRSSRSYRGNSLVLDMHVETDEGACKITDFMPERGAHSHLIRIITCERGRMELTSELSPRFEYGRLTPWIKRISERVVDLVCGPHAATLRAPVDCKIARGGVDCRFKIREGQRRHFVLTYRASNEPVPRSVDPEAELRGALKRWDDWSSRCARELRQHDVVMRSLITIRALAYAPTGGIVAAPTTSLPEQMGGERNWDYRFCWLRDATLTLQALSHAGYHVEAAAWRDWLLRASAGTPSALQPVYGVSGEQRLKEDKIDWLPGFRGSSPVRIGNSAFGQFQLDVYGEVLDAMHQARQQGLPPEEASWELQAALVEHVEAHWREPDRGIWEARHGNEQFTHSKAMAWVATDRAIRAVEEGGFEGPVDRWKRARRAIHETTCTKGFNTELGTFTRRFGGEELDASLLMLPVVGFVDAEDPRMRGTVRAIERGLMRNGYVLRYDTERSEDGLPDGEGAFLACSLWYADNLALQERRDEAWEVFERIAALANDVGLLSEEVDTDSGELLGNFPQALSHLALVNTACNLTMPAGPVHHRSGRSEAEPRQGVVEGADMSQGD
jgi:GH15 family glucan-1,4-alpha-glucosidase